ncbi:MAG TPA: methionine--tRNA ligase subunit beta, partial [Candidatus Methylomirabilis sp.]|nr:methionine--tRNA ligase subunit beta [Candidatus Methylomirabilis sp.]
LGFLREPLQDLSISRPISRLKWGIPLPFDGQYVTYVWFDALINYVSALGYPDGALYREFWPHVEHLIGKDILKPHAVYWPTMLKAAGIPLYRRLNVHGFWSYGGGKMSKSVGNVVEAFQLTDKYGHDAFRYFLLREMTFGLDANFTEEALVGRLNADLANDLGNLASRAATLIVNFAGAAVPGPGAPGAEEATVREAFERARGDLAAAMAEFAFQRALAAIWEFIGTVNRYVDAQAPWALAKDPARKERLDSVLYTLAESLRCLGVVLDPFLPEAAAKLRAAVGAGSPSLVGLAWGQITPGTRVQKIAALFPRIAAAPAEPVGNANPPSSPGERAISIEEFGKVDLRVAEVVAAEKVAKSRKLLKLSVRVGAETRTVVAGVAEHYAPDDLVGRKVIIVANLAPATLMGIESKGMLLAASHEGGLSILVLDKDLPSGAKVK